MNHSRKVILLWIVMLVGLTLSCRKAPQKTVKAPEIEWIKIPGGSEFTHLESIIQDSDANFVIAGSSYDSRGSYRKRCAYFLKIDQEGNEICEHTYPHSERAARIDEIKQTADSGYILVGCICLRKDPGYTDIYVIRTDRNGIIRWTKTLGGEKHDWATCVIEDSMGNFIVGCSTCSFGEGAKHLQSDFYIIKLDERGETLWTKVYEQGGGNEDCNSIQKCDVSGYILIGNRNQYLYMLRVDENGDSLWSGKLGDENQEHCGRSSVKTADGGGAIAGYHAIYRFPTLLEKTISSAPLPIPEAIVRFLYKNFDIGYKTNILLANIDEVGNVTWTQTYGREFHDEAYSVAKSIDGEYVIAGYTASSIGPPGDDASGYIVKTDNQGNILWEMNLKEEGVGILYSIIQTDDSGYVAIGEADSKSILIKLKPEE
jgi:hypothetical protein